MAAERRRHTGDTSTHTSVHVLEELARYFNAR